MQRVAIIGSGGAGKSTLAAELGPIVGLPVVHLDALFWKPGWEETPKAEWAQTNARLVQGERWILDGNYGGTMDARLAAADTVIFLDFPRAVCLWNVFKRAIRFRARSRPDMAPGCPERLDLKFLQWVWRFPERSRPPLLERLTRLRSETVLVRLTSRREVRTFVARYTSG